jgi:hypothetical protein
MTQENTAAKPWAENRVELAEEPDQHGLRVAKVTFNLHENDKRLIEFAKNKVVDVMRARPVPKKSSRSPALRTLWVLPEWDEIGHLRRRQIWGTQISRTPCFRRKHSADAGLGKPRLDHSSPGCSYGRLSRQAGRCHLLFQSGIRYELSPTLHKV